MEPVTSRGLAGSCKQASCFSSPNFPIPHQSLKPASGPFHLRMRLLLSAVLFIVEILAVTLLVDTASLKGTPGLAGLAWGNAANGLRFLVFSAAFSLAFAVFTAPHLFADAGVPYQRRSYRSAGIFHLATFCLFATSSYLLCNIKSSRGVTDLLTVMAATAGVGTMVSCSLLLVRTGFWKAVLQAAPRAPWYGAAVSAATILGLLKLNWLVQPWMNLTFRACYRVLRFLFFRPVFDPATFTLGTQRFQVTVSQQCSGYEGVLLILVFSTVWLFFFRREFRFPQALWMVPVGVMASWALNVCRIVALILIGNAGAPRVAIEGFHSQAGWIAFIMLAISLAVVFQKSSWTASRPQTRSASRSALAVETSAFLLPFLAILAAGMLAQAAGSGFEWLYPLRVLVAAAVLWHYRTELSKLNWRVSGESAALGALVFLLWMGWDRLSGGVATDMPRVFAVAPAYLRSVWMAFRVVGAIITVPIAEELAFRGYLMRRFASVKFSKMSFQGCGLYPVLVSSVAFGLLHGRLWVPGIAAGIVYAIAARRRGRIGDAVLAHSVTNALISLWVAYSGDWHLW